MGYRLLNKDKANRCVNREIGSSYFEVLFYQLFYTDFIFIVLLP
jgi:hypothetical protein